jgi:hypothetical protein
MNGAELTFQRPAACFGEKEVHDRDDGCVQRREDDVRPPGDIVERWANDHHDDEVESPV